MGFRWAWIGLLAASLAAALGAQRLNPPQEPTPAETPVAVGGVPAVAPAQAKTSSATVSKLPAHESIHPVAITPALDPLLAGHDLQVGTFYYNRGDYVGALARFEDAIYNDPTAPEAFCRAGDAEIKLKHLLPARDDWQRCLKTAGEGKWAARARKALAKHPAGQP